MLGPALAGMLMLASPPPAHDIDGIERTKTEAYVEDKYAFCTSPAKPLGPRQRGTCDTAHEILDCQGLIRACDADKEVSAPPDWLTRLVMWLAPLAHVFLYLLVGIIVLAIAIPVITALMQLRRRQRLKAEAAKLPNVATIMAPAAPELDDESDPEEVLRLADEHLARGDNRGAIVFSLAAALRALDRKGAIRVAKHRTNGEYVRACADEAARPRLRELVRTVDAIEFGGDEATADKAQRASSRAKEIVRAALVVATLGLFALGCDPPKKGTDPAGDELPMAILRRNGFDIKPLSTSLSTMPIPAERAGAPVVLIDVESVPLDEETEAHLMRWTEAGGVLVLFGKPDSWPSELAPRAVTYADTRELDVSAPDPNGGLIDEDADEPLSNVGKPIVFSGARITHRDVFAWKDGVAAQSLALLGNKVYASKRKVGRGFVLGVANDDLWTNVGVMPHHNAAALVTLIRAVSHEPHRFVPIKDGKNGIGDLRVARPEDGIPPPSNPFAALIAAGLGRGAWHALAAALLLFLAYGVRHARPRAAPGMPRRAFVEHVEATGAFYARARARTHALAAYGKFIEIRLREAAPRGTDPAAFLAARSGASPERAAELLARASAATTDELPKGDELQIIAELRAMLEKALSTPSRR